MTRTPTPTLQPLEPRLLLTWLGAAGPFNHIGTYAPAGDWIDGTDAIALTRAPGDNAWTANARVDDQLDWTPTALPLPPFATLGGLGAAGGSTVAVSAADTPDAFFVYVHDDNTWSRTTARLPDDSLKVFGLAGTASDRYAVAAGPASGDQPDRVYVFERGVLGAWTDTQTLYPGDTDAPAAGFGSILDVADDNTESNATGHVLAGVAGTNDAWVYPVKAGRATTPGDRIASVADDITLDRAALGTGVFILADDDHNATTSPTGQLGRGWAAWGRRINDAWQIDGIQDATPESNLVLGQAIDAAGNAVFLHQQPVGSASVFSGSLRLLRYDNAWLEESIQGRVSAQNFGDDEWGLDTFFAGPDLLQANASGQQALASFVRGDAFDLAGDTPDDAYSLFTDTPNGSTDAPAPLPGLLRESVSADDRTDVFQLIPTWAYLGDEITFLYTGPTEHVAFSALVPDDNDPDTFVPGYVVVEPTATGARLTLANDDYSDAFDAVYDPYTLVIQYTGEPSDDPASYTLRSEYDNPFPDRQDESGILSVTAPDGQYVTPDRPAVLVRQSRSGPDATFALAVRNATDATASVTAVDLPAGLTGVTVTESLPDVFLGNTTHDITFTLTDDLPTGVTETTVTITLDVNGKTRVERLPITLRLGALTPNPDFNHDGKTDLVWRNADTGDNRVWLMDGDTKLTQKWVPPAKTNWSLDAVGDFDLDGNPDLLWRDHNTGRNTVWLLNANRRIKQSIRLTALDPSWQLAGIRDGAEDAPAATNPGDGFLDLFWRQPDGLAPGVDDTQAWRLGGTTGTVVLETITDSRARWASDANLPGVSDGARVRAVTTTTLDDRVVLRLPDLDTRAGETALTLSDERHVPLTIADFNNDGRLDLIYRIRGGNKLALILDAAGADDDTPDTTLRTGDGWHLAGERR